MTNTLFEYIPWQDNALQGMHGLDLENPYLHEYVSLNMYTAHGIGRCG